MILIMLFISEYNVDINDNTIMLMFPTTSSMTKILVLSTISLFFIDENMPKKSPNFSNILPLWHQGKRVPIQLVYLSSELPLRNMYIYTNWKRMNWLAMSHVSEQKPKVVLETTLYSLHIYKNPNINTKMYKSEKYVNQRWLTPTTFVHGSAMLAYLLPILSYLLQVIYIMFQTP